MNQNDLDAVLNAVLDELDEHETASEAITTTPNTIITSTSSAVASGSSTDPLHQTNEDNNDMKSSSTTNLSEEEAALMEMMKQMKSLFPSGLSDEANVHVKNHHHDHDTHEYTVRNSTDAPHPMKSTTDAMHSVPMLPRDRTSTFDNDHNNNNDGMNMEGVMNHLLSELNKVESNHTNTNDPNEQVHRFIEQMTADLEAKFSNNKDMPSSQTHSNDKEEEEDVMGQVVNGMMKQLLSKEFMYEPMKDICQQYPKWLAENKTRISETEYQNYGRQYQYFQRIVHLYENDPDNTERLTELMNDLQEYGQPPSELVQELAPDLQFDSDGMPQMDGMNMGGFEGLFPPFNSEMMNGMNHDKSSQNSEDDCSIM
jgi:peroxin-19